MKKTATLILALLMIFIMIPHKVFAAENETGVTPSGIAYSDIKSSIDKYIEERKAGLASCEVSVFDRNGVICNGYYGHSDIENNIACDDQTVYEWASTSKIMVWVSVMQQYEKGNIDLNADIREYLPSGFLTKLKYADEKITMINLMNHNAGFQDSFYENQEAKPGDVYENLEAAVRACECSQVFHVGEHTAYSNWGTALAAYIVESASGMDYVTYVNENIFKPLGMEHTSIDPMQRDNKWVAVKRSELKCYGRYADPKDNVDLGECRYAVQLFPAGAAIGTLDDLSKLGQALVAKDCPLFEKNSTRDEMLSATSYYGDTKVGKNCHGLWAQHHKVMTVGHDGNSGGCTCALEIDPASGLGIVIMVNEPGETAFSSGIPVLLYGHMTDREEYRNIAKVKDDKDISGTYYFLRSIIKGAAKASQYTMFFPLSKNSDGTYSAKLLGFTFSDFEYYYLGNDQYLSVDNGREMFVYVKDGIYELPYMDCIKSKTGALPTFISYGFVVFGILCLAATIIKLIAFAVRKIRKSEKLYTAADKMILFQQSVYGVSGVIFYLFIMAVGSCNPAFTVTSCVLAAVLGIASLVNAGLLCVKTVRNGSKAGKKIRQYVWTMLGAIYAVFIVYMQLFDFWHL
ncbi:MAG: beta-lactamase family protein [Clostridiales bacterium]|nr:beta-lactamase family protein [Clostridiales bacterium]